MSSENLHAPRERLSQQTLNLYFAIVSLMEELNAIDWYRQGADNAVDASPRPTKPGAEGRQQPSNTKNSVNEQVEVLALLGDVAVGDQGRLCICIR
jgi:hypothetical protein